ncbi:MG2 domain-containing protein [Myxococcota bacterium]
MTYSSIDSPMRWLGGLRFWLIVAGGLTVLAAILGGYAIHLSSSEADTQEAFLYAQPTIVPGAPARYQIFARDGQTGAPIPEAKARVALVDTEERVLWRGDAVTNEAGMAPAEAMAPADLKEGTYAIRATVTSDLGESVVRHPVKAERGFKVMLSTDKPLYQPGQVIHIRALALATADLRPMAARETLLQVQDPKGNKVFKKKVKTSAYGIVSADFQLADRVNTGEYRITATIDESESERSVKVERYRLPKFKITLDAERGAYQPGETVKCELDAQYTFGEPVADARVQVVASEFVTKLRPFARARGRTNAKGKHSFEIPLKRHFVGTARKQGDAFVTLEAKVKDKAGHELSKTLDLTISNQPLRIEVFPESGELVRNVENLVYILTAYPDGTPAQTRLTVDPGDTKLETSRAGIAELKLTPTLTTTSLRIRASDAAGVRTEVTRNLQANQREEAILLRTDRAVYRTGETLKVTAFSAAGAGRVFFDVVKDRRTVLTDVLDVENGRADKSIDLPADLFGTLELHAYRVMADGNMMGDARVVQVTPASDLAIRATLDKQTYRPAEKALIRFAVTRASGEPTQAALGLSGVDEAVFALQEARPGLERVYFMLQEEILEPRYEIETHVPFSASQAIQQSEPLNPEQQQAGIALFSLAKGGGPPQRAASLLWQEQQRLFEHERQAFFEKLGAIGYLVPTMLFLLLCLPLFVYALFRLRRPESIAGLKEEDAATFKRAARRLGIWWALGLYVPAGTLVVLAAIAAEVVRSRYREEFVGVTAFLVTIAMLVQIILWTIRFVRAPAAQALPALKRAVALLPAAYLFAVIGVICTLLVAEGFQAFEPFWVVSVLFLVGLTLVGVVGALSVSAANALQTLSVGTWITHVLTRTALVGTPMVVLGVIGLVSEVPSDSYALTQAAFDAEIMPVAAMPEGGEQEKMMAPARAGGAGTAGGIGALATTGKKSKDETAQESLKAPTRVRRYFPETLLWIPELVTDEKGEASLEVPLADSITTWRIGMSAVSGKGELGAGTTPLKVFQDFFIDIDFPVALTQNDRVSVPIAVFNYLEEPQEVRLEVEEDDWYQLNGPSKFTLKLQPGQVTSRPLTFTALKPGKYDMTVRAHGSKMADAVERSIRVEPDGKRFDKSFSGRLESAVVTERLEIPRKAIDGASNILVRLYPGMFSQVVGGIDSLLRLPGG